MAAKNSSSADDEKYMRDSRSTDATLVIRYWEEPGRPDPFRARVSYSHGPGEAPAYQYAANAEQVLSIVRVWLASLTAPDSKG